MPLSTYSRKDVIARYERQRDFPLREAGNASPGSSELNYSFSLPRSAETPSNASYGKKGTQRPSPRPGDGRKRSDHDLGGEAAQLACLWLLLLLRRLFNANQQSCGVSGLNEVE